MITCLSPNGPTVTELDAAPRRLAVATIRGIGVVERDRPGAPWRLVARTLEGNHVSALASLPGGSLVAGMHSGGLFVSGDGGLNWESRTNGLTISHVFSLALDMSGGNATIYAGTEPASLFYSRDLGRTWTELPAIAKVPGRDKWTFPPPPHIAHTKSLTFDRRAPGTIYACIEQGGLFKSTDNGATWRELDSYYRTDDYWYRDIHRVVIMPSDRSELIMTTGEGLYRSTDAGETWERLTGRNFRIGYPDHLLVSPTDENVLHLSGAATDPATWRDLRVAHGTVMTSRDRGRNWSLSDRGLNVAGRANIEAMGMATWSGGYALFAGDTDGSVFCSEDGAQSWELVVSGLAPVSKVGHFRHLQTAPAAT